MDEDHYHDGMSPPSSVNDSDSNNLPSLSAAAAAAAQSFAVCFTPYEYSNHIDDDEDMDGEHEIDEDMLRGHTETVSCIHFHAKSLRLTCYRRPRMRTTTTLTGTATTMCTTLLSPMCTTTLSLPHTTITFQLPASG